LTELFDNQDQILPQSSVSAQKLPAFKQLSLTRQISNASISGPATSSRPDSAETASPPAEQIGSNTASDTQQVVDSPLEDRIGANGLLQDYISRHTKPRAAAKEAPSRQQGLSKSKERLMAKLGEENNNQQADDSEIEISEEPEINQTKETTNSINLPRAILDSNKRTSEASSRPVSREQGEGEEPIPSIKPKPFSSQPGGVIPNAFDRIRARRATAAPEIAIVTIGSQMIQSQIGTSIPTPAPKRRRIESSSAASSKLPTSRSGRKLRVKTFIHGLRSFAAPGTQVQDDSQDDQDDDEEGQKEDEETEQAEESPEDDVEVEVQNPNDLEPDSPSSRGNEATMTNRPSDAESYSDYVDDEEEKKAEEDARVTKLIEAAEIEAVVPSEDSLKRAEAISKGLIRKKDSIIHLTICINASLSHISDMIAGNFGSNKLTLIKLTPFHETPLDPNADTAEARLSLTVSKADFRNMRISGQFNLGFILATRGSSSSSPPSDLFIIDQHASDEKYNFERLQATTIVQNQRLVQPLALDLTAIEEETILDCVPSLEKNGFVISIDTSGARPVGRRCQLLSLPMSKEVVFNQRDLEELLVLLAERSSGTEVPRPSKVRKMFAMRACRSSIMIGKTLTRRQMEGVVRRMGEIEKPWNCPHGRPTMRHLIGLGEWESWQGDFGDGPVDWADYPRALKHL
jgi:DNA mismatch repair protein PMS2